MMNSLTTHAYRMNNVQYVFYTTRNIVSILQGLETSLSMVQIKNIKLHIVTDIKVTINSLSAFGFRHLVGGLGYM